MRGELTFTGEIQDGLPSQLFPLCPAQIFVDDMPPGFASEFLATYDIVLKEHAYKIIGAKVIDKIVDMIM